MSNEIVEVLRTLDVDNDDHWTIEGLPRMDVVQEQVPYDITRGDITAAAKGFSRKNPVIDDPTNEGTQDNKQTSEEQPTQTEEPDDAAKIEKTAADDVEDDAYRKAEQNLAEAREVANKAQKALKAAQEAMDIQIRKKENGKDPRIKNILAVKDYQKAQFEQRKRELGL